MGRIKALWRSRCAGAEAIELRNCLLCFGGDSEELRVVVARLADWMANSSPPGSHIAHLWHVS